MPTSIVWISAISPLREELPPSMMHPCHLEHPLVPVVATQVARTLLDNLGCRGDNQPGRRRPMLQGTRGQGCPSSCTNSRQLQSLRQTPMNRDDECPNYGGARRRTSRAFLVTGTYALPFPVRRQSTAEMLEEKEALEKLESSDKKAHRKKKKSVGISVVSGLDGSSLPFVSQAYEQEKQRQTKRRQEWKQRHLRRRSSLFNSISPPPLIPGLPFPIPDELTEDSTVLSFTRHRDTKIDIASNAQAAIRDTFAVQCKKGWLKKPCVHVSFTYPKNLDECCTCGDSDFLFVYVGLCNIFVLQFVVVVVLFFSEKDVDLFASVQDYYPGYYKGDNAF